MKYGTSGLTDKREKDYHIADQGGIGIEYKNDD